MGNEKKKKILVIDDDDRWLTKIHKILSSDYELTLATEPTEAIEILRTNIYSLVILDMKFPAGVSGLDVFSQMQEIAPNLRSIILTGYPDTSSMRSSFKQGFLDYLSKSSGDLSRELKAVVREALEKSETHELTELIKKGEGNDLEFKSSARWDMRLNSINRELEKVIVKTLAAFLNSPNGGVLLIGIDDDRKIIGLANDYKTLGKRQDKDGYENLLMTLLLDACGKECSPLIRFVFYQIDGNEVCCVKVKASPKPIFVKDDKGEHFFVRTGNSTRLLSTREAMEYCKIQWRSSF